MISLKSELWIFCISNCICLYFVTKRQLVFSHFSPQEAFTYVSSVYDNCSWCQRIIVVIIYPRGACVLNKKLLKMKYLSKFRLYWAIWIFREQRSITSVKLMYRDCKLYSFRYCNEIHYKHQFVKFNVIVGGRYLFKLILLKVIQLLTLMRY